MAHFTLTPDETLAVYGAIRVSHRSIPRGTTLYAAAARLHDACDPQGTVVHGQLLDDLRELTGTLPAAFEVELATTLRSWKAARKAGLAVPTPNGGAEQPITKKPYEQRCEVLRGLSRELRDIADRLAEHDAASATEESPAPEQEAVAS